jgi:hypothetical protein
MVAVAALPGCVPKGDITLAFDSARFNERIRADFKPLTMDDQNLDHKFGFFSDGSDGGLVSEIHPFPLPVPAASASPGSPTSFLVQTPCLFIGNELYNGLHSAGDELRLAWELIGNFDRSSSELAAENFVEGYEDLGMCTLSSPINRLLFEHPELPLKDHGLSCSPDDPTVEFALTLSKDDPSHNANIPSNCIVGHDWREVVLETFSPKQTDPDGLCPTVSQSGRLVPSHFTDRSVVIRGSASACGMSPTDAEPVEDTSYRLSLKAENSFGNAMPERWLSPNVMAVNLGRDIVRKLHDDSGTGDFHWETPVQRLNDRLAQWEENYTPTVLVKRVEILSRDGSGLERNERPNADRLRVVVPQPSGTPATVSCIGSVKDGRFSFSIPDECSFDDNQLRALTPTYAPAFLSALTPVTSPIAWHVNLGSSSLSGRTPFIRFSLRVQTQGAALRISAAKNFGALQVHRWRQDALILENIGGADVEVRSIAFTPWSPNPQDFSFIVAGDPVDVPLPIEARPDRAGAVLQPSADASDAAILDFKDDGAKVEVTLGDPSRGRGTEPLTLYRQPVRLVGGLLLRDDPAAVFSPTARAYPRPFSIPAFAERQPPFLLPAGESVKIVVIAQPATTGVRRAEIRAEAVPIGTPTQTLRATSVLSVDALDGPQLRVIPEPHLYFHRNSSSQARDYDRAVVLMNVGYFDLGVTRVAIVGRDAARFALQFRRRSGAPFTLVPGDSEDLVFTYTPECDGSYSDPDHEASLVVESNGGNWRLPLYGSSYGFCDLP